MPSLTSGERAAILLLSENRLGSVLREAIVFAVQRSISGCYRIVARLNPAMTNSPCWIALCRSNKVRLSFDDYIGVHPNLGQRFAVDVDNATLQRDPFF